jgi:heme A synthase
MHPTIAVLVGIYLILTASVVSMQSGDSDVKRFARLLTLLVTMQLVAGFVNVLLLAPVWMQILHLLLADLVWIVLVLLSATRLAVQLQSEHISGKVQSSLPLTYRL